MNNSIRTAVAAAVLSTLASVSATAQEARAGGDASTAKATLSELVQRTRAARLAGDKVHWLEYGRQLLALAPDHQDLLISVARALAANGRVDEALGLLEGAVRRGAGFDLAMFPEFREVAAGPRLDAVRAAAANNQAPVSPPEVFLVLKDPQLRPEGITYDPRTRNLYIGSLDGQVWKVDLQRQLKLFVGPGAGLREVLGLKVDAQRRLLWMVNGVFPDLFAAGEPKKDVGITGVQAFHLGTRTRVRNCALDERPTLHGFNDLALASNGDVYVTDSTANAIYRLPGGECRLERVLQDEAMSFPNGIVLGEDESRLYVAHVEGISAVDVRTGKRTQLGVPANAAVNSIDGLVRDGADLLGVQGSPYLARTVRIRLTADGMAVREVSTMNSRPPMGLNQTTGVVVGEHFYTVGGFPDGAAPPGQPQPLSHILRGTLR